MGPVGGGGRKKVMADINITPFVDVMLVLLIVFMVSAPMMTQGLDVDLPETTARALPQEEKPLIVTLDKDGNVFIGEIGVSMEVLGQQLATLDEEKKKSSLYLKADKDVDYGLVVEVMAKIKNAGFKKIGMVTKS